MQQTAEQLKLKLHTVGVQFRTASTIHTFSTEEAQLALGERVIVESDDGPSVATVITTPVPVEKLPGGTKRLLHRATTQEIDLENQRREEAHRYFQLCESRIKERKLDMKLTDAEVVGDGKKVRFVFYAENRIDFRSLIKELANSLRMRIEMRQIGARDETKYRGCLGACGQVTTCCSTFLRQFRSISIGMAKNQGLAPNPEKLTGLCGKLKCCLAYENEQYQESKKGLVKPGTIVSSPNGIGRVMSIDILNRRYSLRLDEGGDAKVKADECERLDPAKKAAREQAFAQKAESDRLRAEQFRKRKERQQQRKPRAKPR